VVLRYVLLHLWRLFQALCAWEIAGNDFCKDASRYHLARSIAGDGWGHGNSESDAVSVASPAYRNESLLNIVFGAVYSVIMILAIWARDKALAPLTIRTSAGKLTPRSEDKSCSGSTSAKSISQAQHRVKPGRYSTLPASDGRLFDNVIYFSGNSIHSC
jgi:hypothetical protein